MTKSRPFFQHDPMGMRKIVPHTKRDAHIETCTRCNPSPLYEDIGETQHDLTQRDCNCDNDEDDSNTVISSNCYRAQTPGRVRFQIPPLPVPRRDMLEHRKASSNKIPKALQVAKDRSMGDKGKRRSELDFQSETVPGKSKVSLKVRTASESRDVQLCRGQIQRDDKKQQRGIKFPMKEHFKTDMESTRRSPDRYAKEKLVRSESRISVEEHSGQIDRVGACWMLSTQLTRRYVKKTSEVRYKRTGNEFTRSECVEHKLQDRYQRKSGSRGEHAPGSKVMYSEIRVEKHLRDPKRMTVNTRKQLHITRGKGYVHVRKKFS